MKTGYIYIITNKRNGTLYIGVTSNLAKRLHEHRAGLTAGFSKTYRLNKLVYFEAAVSIDAAIAREKQLKGWRRAWKIALIEKGNPYWRDLYPEII